MGDNESLSLTSELVTASQMRAIEQAAIVSGHVTGRLLMEQAGQGVVEAIFETWPRLGAEVADRAGHPKTAPRRAVVLAGPGNNGGDGFVIARLLQARGWSVEVFFLGDVHRLPAAAADNHRRWAELGQVTQMTRAAILESKASLGLGPHLVIDAVFGSGLTRPLSPGLCKVLIATRGTDHFARAKWVAIDVPSGLCADSGRYLAQAEIPMPQEMLTVTFHARKLGHVLADGPEICRNLVVKQIGLPGLPIAHPKDLWSAMGDSAALTKPIGSHKYTHGHALVLSGGAGKTGAARLAARGALRIGAGLVTLGVPGPAQLEVATQATAVMLKRVDAPDHLAAVLEDTRLNALCLGPGMGMERARDLVPVALTANRHTVLDADALTAFETGPSTLFSKLHDRCVLTPHDGEFGRLFPDIAAELTRPATKGPAYSKVDATRAAAKRAGCVVVFKGPDTVIAHPDGRCAVQGAVYDRAAPWLATAGSGDVLAGFTTGLLARGFQPMAAAETGAWLHVACARAFGPGLIAEDLPEMLPQVFRDLGV